MEQARRAQLMYLSQDTKLLSKLSNKILDDLNKTGVKSGFSSPYVSNHGYRFNCSSQVYVSSLESIVNRLHEIIGHIVSCFPNLATENRNIASPKFITFGNAMNLLYARIRELTESESKKHTISVVNEDEGMTNLYKHEETQTSETTIDRCDSCSISEGSIKKIKFAMESELDLSSGDMRMIRFDEEFNITQQGAMMRVTNSLENKLYTIFRVLRDKSEEIEIAKQDCNKLNKDLSDERNFSSVLMNENDTLEQKVAENESTIASLTSERDHLRYENAEYEKQIEILKKQSSAHVESIMLCKKLLSNCQNEIDQWKEVFGGDKSSLLINYRQRIERIDANIKEIDSDITNLGERLTSLATSVDVMCETMDKITRTCHGIDLRISDLIDKCSLSNYVKTLFSKCQDVVNITVEKGGTNHFESNTNEPAKLTALGIVGDPLADMTQQIEQNRKLIQKLGKQTRKLEKVVELLSTHRK